MEFLIIGLAVTAASSHAFLSSRQLKHRFAEDERRVAGLKNALAGISPDNQ